jgi:hypothetical protein
VKAPPAPSRWALHAMARQIFEKKLLKRIDFQIEIEYMTTEKPP